MLAAAVALAFVTANPAVAGNVIVPPVFPSVKLKFSTFDNRLAKVIVPAGSVEITNVSLPAPPSIVEPIRNAAVVLILSSKVVVKPELLVFKLLDNNKREMKILELITIFVSHFSLEFFC